MLTLIFSKILGGYRLILHTVVSNISSAYTSLIGSLKTCNESLKVWCFFSPYFTNLDRVYSHLRHTVWKI